MSRKVWISLLSAILITVLAAAWGPADAQAQGGGLRDRPRKPHIVIGQVTAVTASAVTLHTLRGDDIAFGINAGTRVRSRDGGDADLADVSVDAWVGVVPVRAGELGGTKQPLARAIVLLPEDFDPANAQAARGKVTAVDAAGNRFTIKTLAGEDLNIVVNAAAVYKGEVGALADLKVGMAAAVVAEKQPNGELLAKAVRAGYPRMRRMGEVVSVNAAAGQFTLKLHRDGTELTVRVDDVTRFRSKNGEVQSLANLQPGMAVAIQGREQPDGTTLAHVVVLLPKR